ncbi:hypothetical protein CK203_089491 [Vitis vinifera]|uniref:Reverse transcriptase/retrotransposon-derived protein RNase H-like domain-containing protein n=1 Tax=Vitis vinifera TaxID=29760 RepID=A0A438FJ70_VITVI|nr:hypothetical protein CK203_089491 [Vitis vinifera]
MNQGKLLKYLRTGQATVDELKELNLGTNENPRPIYKCQVLIQKLQYINSWEVKYPTWIANIVPVKKKNGQIRVCVDFRDLNNACPKDDFHYQSSSLWLMQLLVMKLYPSWMDHRGATYQRAMQKIFDDMLHKNVKKVPTQNEPAQMCFWCYFWTMSTLQPTYEERCPFVWDEACHNAFESIKKYLANPPILGAPMAGKPLILYIAAQECSLGALLAQENEENKESIAYTVHLIAHADPIKYVLSKPVLSGLARWGLLLTEYEIIYIPQKAIKGQALADFLADHPIPTHGKFQMTSLMRRSFMLTFFLRG